MLPRERCRRFSTTTVDISVRKRRPQAANRGFSRPSCGADQFLSTSTKYLLINRLGGEERRTGSVYDKYMKRAVQECS
jgi:hypothetical protein